MGIKITLKCDLCPHEDTTYTWGEDPQRFGWRITEWVCICPECNKQKEGVANEKSELVD